jgi:uncharacterized protein (TIGR03086 family)
MIQGLQQAIASTRSVLAKVTPGQLGGATPCASWNVAELINHIVGAQHFFTAALNGAPPSGESPDFAAGDYLAEFDAAAAITVEAFSAPGALGRTVKLPFAEMPGAAWLGLATTDTFTHGWDLAKATGQSTDLAPELAETVLQNARMAIQPAFRGEDGKAPFTAEQQAPEGASAADRLAAFLGRTV